MLTKAEEEADSELEPGLAGAVVPAPTAEAEAGIRRGGSRGSSAAGESDAPSAVRPSTSSRRAEAVLAKPCSVRNAMTSSRPGAAMRAGGRIGGDGGVGAQARGGRREVSSCVAIGTWKRSESGRVRVREERTR
jgi:hypothetical protein